MMRGKSCAVYAGYGFDTIQPMPKLALDAFQAFVKAKGFVWIARYGPRYKWEFYPTSKEFPPKKRYVMAVDEAEFLRVKCKLKILPVQLKPGSTLGDGTTLGFRMGKWAHDMKIAKGVQLWCDMEGRASENAGVSGFQKFVNEWAAGAWIWGYKTGLYLAQSFPQGLKSEHLKGLPITGFWKSANKAPVPEPAIGAAIRQRAQRKLWLDCRTPAEKKMNIKKVYNLSSGAKLNQWPLSWDPDFIFPSGYGAQKLWG